MGEIYDEIDQDGRCVVEFADQKGGYICAYYIDIGSRSELKFDSSFDTIERTDCLQGLRSYQDIESILSCSPEFRYAGHRDDDIFDSGYTLIKMIKA